MSISFTISPKRTNPGTYNIDKSVSQNFQTYSDQIKKYKKSIVDIAKNPKQLNKDKAREFAKKNGSTFSGKVFDFFTGASNIATKNLGYIPLVGKPMELAVSGIQKLAQSGKNLRLLLDHDHRGQGHDNKGPKKLTYAGADFAKTSLTNFVQFDLAKIQGNFERTNFSSSPDGKQVEFNGVTFIKSNFKNANLSKVKLQAMLDNKKVVHNNNFIDSNLEGANLSSNDFSCANFIGSNLNNIEAVKANFSGTCFDKSSLINANLEKANLKGSNLENLDLSKANLKNIEIDSSTKLNGVILKAKQAEELNLNKQQINDLKITIVDAPIKEVSADKDINNQENPENDNLSVQKAELAEKRSLELKNRAEQEDKTVITTSNSTTKPESKAKIKPETNKDSSLPANPENTGLMKKLQWLFSHPTLWITVGIAAAYKLFGKIYDSIFGKKP